MDKITKFLQRLAKKDRTIFFKIFEDIKVLQLERYDVKTLKGYKDMFRLRKGIIRVIFVKIHGRGVIVGVGHRKDIYEKM